MQPTITWDVSPIFVQYHGFDIRYYGALMVATFLGGHLLLLRQIHRGGGGVEEAGDFLTYGIVGVLLGARAAHVLFYDFEHFAQQPRWMFEIWKGGLASHGALVGVVIAMYWFTKRRAIPLLEGTDRLVYSAALGATLIRLGNLFNSEIVGKVTDGTWGVRFPRRDIIDAPLRHPSQLYEAALALAVFLLLVACDRALGRERRPQGALSAIFLVAYFGGRFLLEFWKENEGISPNAVLNLGQLLSLPCFVAGMVLLLRSLRHKRAAGWVVRGASALSR